MALTTTNLFGETVEYPTTPHTLTDPKDEQETEVKDTITGNLFLQDFVEMNSDELSYILQNTND